MIFTSAPAARVLKAIVGIFEDAGIDNPKKPFWKKYRAFFSVGEIESDIALKWLMGAILLGFYVTFFRWAGDIGNSTNAVANNSYLCWPFWQSCGSWYWLTALPDGYSKNIFFMGLFAITLWVVNSMRQAQWALAHLGLLLLFIAKMYFTTINYTYHNNWDYYHSFFALIFIFFPHKRFFSQLMIVMFYFLSTASKISPSWTLGSYFTALKTDLPIFPKGTEIFFTNLVIFEEMIGVWFLFSRNWILQRSTLLFFIIFHLYSGILVYYLYPSLILPELLILFGPWFKPYNQGVPLNKKAIAGWSLMLFFTVSQMIPRWIEGNERLTMEGNFYGMYMFEANHQCTVNMVSNGRRLSGVQSTNAQRRCDVYTYWFRMKNRWCPEATAPIHLVIDHSINGGPFYRIVDEADACNLTYKPFTHNAWIKDDSNAPAVGRALENVYR